MAINLTYGQEVEINEDAKFWDYQVSDNSILLALQSPEEGQIANVLNTTGVLNPFTSTKLKGLWVYNGGIWEYASQDLQDKLVQALSEIASNDTDITNLQNSKIDSVIAGTNTSIDYTDPKNPIINATLLGGNVSTIFADDTTVSPNGSEPTELEISNFLGASINSIVYYNGGDDLNDSPKYTYYVDGLGKVTRLNPYNNTLRTSVSGEESSNLTAGQFEFSQGNGGKGQSWGKVINRDWYLDGMSLSVNNIGGSNTIIELYVNGQATGKTLTLIAGDNVAYQNFSSTDLLGSAGDYINFLTIQSGGATGGRVSAYLHHNGDDDNSSGGGGGTTPNLNADMDYTFSNYDTSAGGQTRVNFEIHRVSGASGFRIQFQNVNWTGISVQNPNGATFANIGGGIVEMYGTIQNVGEIVNAVLISTTGEGGTQNPTGNPPTAYSLIP